MRKHYTRTLTGYRCINPQCREEFDDRKTLGKHYGKGGVCIHPLRMGVRLMPNLDISPYHWSKAA